MNDVPLFDWDNGLVSECNRKWRKTNTITKYNPNNYELENKNILGIYSSALYGYDGQLATAVAGNARQNEIAFEGFEDYDGSTITSTYELAPTNLEIYTTETPTGTIPLLHEHEVISGNSELLVVDIPYDPSLSISEVKIYGAGLQSQSNPSILGTYQVSSIEPYPEAGNDDKSVVVLAGVPFAGLWTGKLTYTTLVSPNVTLINGGFSAPSLSSRAHSGSASFKIQGNTEMDQHKLVLNPGDRYVISAWVSLDEAEVPNWSSFESRPVIGTHLGITEPSLEINLNDGQSVTLENIGPSGDIINGWQRMEGEFTVPSTFESWSLKLIGASTFSPNNGSAVPTYFDDIRIFPADGNMQSYVYDKDLRLQATLDHNNYATFYYYDPAGNLYLTKKETERGVMTLQETFGHVIEQP